MKHLQNQKGVALIFELILVAVVASALTIVGYRYYQSKHQASSPTTNQSSKPKTNNVLKIPELGIQMTLPSGLSKDDVVYFVDNTYNGAHQDSNGKTYHSLGVAKFSTKTLDAEQPTCTPTASSDIEFGIEKLGEDLQAGNYSIGSGPTNFTKVGDFYVAISDKQAVCGNYGDQDISKTFDSSLEKKVEDQFVEAFKTVKAIE